MHHPTTEELLTRMRTTAFGAPWQPGFDGAGLALTEDGIVVALVHWRLLEGACARRQNAMLADLIARFPTARPFRLSDHGEVLAHDPRTGAAVKEAIASVHDGDTGRSQFAVDFAKITA